MPNQTPKTIATVSVSAHGKRILAALVLLDGCGLTPASRGDLARIIFDRYIGLQFNHLRALQEAGLVTPDIPESAELVDSGRCTCGCDMWFPTKLGIDLAATFKVQLGENARKAIEHKWPFTLDRHDWKKR